MDARVCSGDFISLGIPIECHFDNRLEQPVVKTFGHETTKEGWLKFLCLTRSFLCASVG